MAARMVHRGPDEEGFHVGDGVGLAFRRLRIVDLHTGSQPQANEDGRVRVVFNGEIYNHAALRRDLESRGHVFRTVSDTEVLVHLYEERGADLVTELEGMFAFALWDEREHRLLLARDPLGIKPLLYAVTAEGFVFASEAGPILEAPGVDTSVDPVALHHFLSWGAIPAPRTMRRGIRSLEPGHLATWCDGTLSTRRYWHPLDGTAEPPASYPDARRLLRERLEDSVRLQRVADVPLGAFLSGGVDSTALVGLLAREATDVHTFSVGFAGMPVFDETPFAREAAAFHGTQHAETQLDPGDVRAAIPAVLDRLDEPFGSSSLLPAYVVARETRRHMTVALSGDGADELFAGYEKYLGEAYRATWNRIPGPLRGLASGLVHALPVSRSSRSGELTRKARRFLAGVHDDDAVRHEGWMRIAATADVAALLGGGGAGDPGLEVVRALHEDFARHGGTDPLNRVLFTDLSLALPSDMLRKVDTASMLNSLEVRVPYLDRRVIALAMSMPGAWKMRGTRRKRVLKDAVRDLLPRSVLRRGKAGFEVPIGEWIRSDLRGMFRDVLGSAGGLPLDTTAVTRLVEEHESGRADHAKILWAILSLKWWERRTAAPPAPPAPRPAASARWREVASEVPA